MLVEGPLDQHHRHAGSRGLHGRGRALPPGARRRRGRVRRRGRRRAADRDRLASGRPLRRSPHLLREQDGPHRRRLRANRRHDGRPAPGAPARPAAAVGDRGRLQGRHRHRGDEGARLGRRDGRGVAGRGHPAGLPRGRRGRPSRAVRAPRRPRRVPHGEVRPRGRAHDRRAPARDPPCDARERGRARALRVGVQEQGRAAAAGRDHLVPALPAGRSPDGGARPEGRGGHQGCQRRGAVLRARVQDHVRPVRRTADLPARLLGRAQGRLPRPELDEGPQGADRPHPPDAREPPGGQGRGVHGRHHGRRRSQALHHRRHHLATRINPSSWSPSRSRSPSSPSPSSRRRRPTRTSWATASRSSPTRTRRSS